MEVLAIDQKEKNGERKGGKYLEKENIWSVEEKEKEENIWRGEKYSFLEGKLTTTDNWVNI